MLETVSGDGSKGIQPEHFNDTDGARTKNGMHPCRKYNNVASEATYRGQARAGGTVGVDRHGAMENSAGLRRAEEGDKNLQRALPA